MGTERGNNLIVNGLVSFGGGNLGHHIESIHRLLEHRVQGHKESRSSSNTVHSPVRLRDVHSLSFLSHLSVEFFELMIEGEINSDIAPRDTNAEGDGFTVLLD